MIGLNDKALFLKDFIFTTPKVIYKGQEIKLNKEVVFHWETDSELPGGMTIEIEHEVKDSNIPKSNRIVERIKSHLLY